MLRTFGVDILDPSVTLRRVWVLVNRLPPGAWADHEHDASWSIEAHLLASAIDALNQLTWVTVATNSKSKPKRPKPVKRPGDTARKGSAAATLMKAMGG